MTLCFNVIQNKHEYALAICTHVWLQFYSGLCLPICSLSSAKIELAPSNVTCVPDDLASETQ